MQYTYHIKVPFEANSEEEAARIRQRLSQAIHTAPWAEMPDDIVGYLRTVYRKGKYLRGLKLANPADGVKVNKATGFLLHRVRKLAAALHINLE
jgi:hypothetical protein